MIPSYQSSSGYLSIKTLEGNYETDDKSSIKTISAVEKDLTTFSNNSTITCVLRKKNINGKKKATLEQCKCCIM